MHTLGPSSMAAVTHIAQHTTPCPAFPYFCQRTTRANPRRLHQAGRKHAVLRICHPVQTCSTCCSHPQSHNLAYIRSELCNIIIVPQMNLFHLHKPRPFAQEDQERATALAVAIGGCSGWNCLPFTPQLLLGPGAPGCCLAASAALQALFQLCKTTD